MDTPIDFTCIMCKQVHPADEDCAGVSASGSDALLSSGFESAERLIGYCEIHCETPRALFNGKQVNDMLKLAGHPDGWVLEVGEDEWFSLHDEMSELCKLARERLAS